MMKRLVNYFLLITLAIVMAACQSEETLSFSDEKLEAEIRVEMDKPDGEIIKSDLDGITKLDLSGLGIEQLDGIEYIANLEILNLQDNNIRDLSPLENLQHLKQLTIANNPIDESSEVNEHFAENDVEVITTVAVEVVGSPDGPGGYLWKVENGSTTVYLQGTIHAATEDFYPLHEKIEQAYAEANIIVPEIDLNNVNPMEVQGITMELAVYNDGTTIQDHLPDEVYTELDATLQELGMPVEMIKSFKPWFLSSTIQQLMIEQLGYTHGVDEYFLNRADQDDKEVIGLETVEQQLRIFSDTSPEYQTQMLQESLIELDDFEKQMQEMFSLYKEGDVDKLLDYLTDEEVEVTADEQAFMEAINDNRNYGMAETVMEFLEEDSGDTYFVIVGSLHLILEPHVIFILEDEGYKVEHIH